MDLAGCEASVFVKKDRDMSYYRYDNKYGLEYGQGLGEPLQTMYQREYPDVVPVTHSMTLEEAERTYFDLRRSAPKKKKPEPTKDRGCEAGFCKRK